VANNDLTNTFPKNEYTVLNAKAAYRWKWLTVFAVVNNLLDTAYQSYPAVTAGVQQRGFNPSPGINAQAGASVTF
jgi:outer membrane receptor protein involved in Fe transport